MYNHAPVRLPRAGHAVGPLLPVARQLGGLGHLLLVLKALLLVGLGSVGVVVGCFFWGGWFGVDLRRLVGGDGWREASKERKGGGALPSLPLYTQPTSLPSHLPCLRTCGVLDGARETLREEPRVLERARLTARLLLAPAWVLSTSMPTAACSSVVGVACVEGFVGCLGGGCQHQRARLHPKPLLSTNHLTHHTNDQTAYPPTPAPRN